jgi:linoleoyl-CoA desaturase
VTEHKNITFGKPGSDFFPVLRKRVDNYFKENNIKKSANGAMVFKTVFILFVYLLTYGLILSNILDPIAILAVCGVHGFFAAMIGLNIGHDAVHGAYSTKSKVNKGLSIVFNLAGANDYVWSITHNLLHHTFTNVPNYDDDIAQPPVLRVNPKNDIWFIHRFQFIYAFLLYTLSSFSWVLRKDYVKFFTKNLGGYKEIKHPKKEYYRLFFYKALYYIFALVVPMLVVDSPWYSILLGFYVCHAFEGFTLAIIFHLAHLVEGTEFPEASENKEIEYGWAELQMRTTADFARNSELANFICGGLNFQIEHHLFPAICSIHYKKLAPIVEQTAKEYGLPYIDNKSFFKAVASHVRLLKKFGKE